MINNITVHHETTDYFGKRDGHTSVAYEPYMERAEAAVRKLFRRFHDGNHNEVMHIHTDEVDHLGSSGIDHVVSFDYDCETDRYRAMMFEWYGNGNRTESRPVTMADVMRIIRANYEESE